MTLDPVKVLARTISGISAEQDTIKQNMSADDADSQLIANFTFNVLTQGTAVASKYTYSAGSFILDHPVYGELDSSKYALDGGYWGGASDYGQKMYLNTLIQPSSGNVNDLSTYNNDGTFNVNMTAYYPFNGNANDESINTYNGTVTSATLTTDHLANTNNAYNFATNAANINLGASFTFSGNITIAGWVRPTSNGTITIYNKWSGAYTNFLLFDLVGLQLRSTVYTAGTGSSNYSTTLLQLGVWSHVAFTVSGATYTFYINGVASGTGSLTSGSIPSYSGTAYIGYRGDSPNDEWQGDISEMCFISSALTSAQISSLYNATSIHKLDKPLNTLSTLTGYEFTGQQYITLPAYDTLYGAGALGNANSTYIEFVMKSYPSTWGCLLGNGSSSRIQIQNNGTILVDDWNGLGTYDIYSDAGAVVINTKHRLLLTVDSSSSSNNLNIYLDGILIKTNSIAATTANFSGTVYLGSYNTALANACDAIISKPIIFNRVLTDEERTNLFAGYINPEVLYSTTF